jgi:hypothetical protein
MNMNYIPIRHLAFALITTLCSLPSFGQFTDDFSDGNITANPEWTGNTAVFIVNPSLQLQLNDVVDGQSVLSTSHPSVSLSAADMEWQIWVKQTFSGSDNNQSRIYLSANGVPASYPTPTGTAGVQGYFLKLGEGGSADAIKLCRDNGSGTIAEIGAGTASLIASSFTVRIRVTRTAGGLWNVSADPAGGTAFTPQLTVTDATYTSSDHFGIICKYTSSNADNFFFDDIYFGPEIIDSEPPQLLSATATSANTLDVLFSEPVNTTTAQNQVNYDVPGIGNPTSAAMNTASSVELTFSSSFPENTTQTLNVSGITDLSGNAISPSSMNFTWFVTGQSTFRDVVFNEVLADPTPEVGLPAAEYIELYNTSDQAFDLTGWRLVNTTTVKTLPSFTLPPDGYIVLCSDQFSALFNPSVGISGFTALTNDGDSLTLLNDQGTLIDVLKYSIGWYDTSDKASGGWSLEQINPQLACNSSSNWEESENPIGGTPGVQNSVYDPTPDTTVPALESVEVITSSILVLTFSEVMDSESISDAEFSMAPDFVFSNFSWNPENTSLTVTASPLLAAETPYVLQITGLRDCSGNLIDPVSWDMIIGNTPQTGDILFNEIMADPDPVVGGPAAEYIELYNASGGLIDLKNSTLNGESFNSQTLIAPGGYLIVADDANALAFLAFPGTVFLENFPGLTNSGSTLTLENPDGDPLDQVAYSIIWYGDPAKDDGGWSLELINPLDPCSDASNWTASTSALGMTAGSQNSVYDVTPDTSAPEFVLLLNEPEGFISLQFNEPLDEATLAGLSWSIDGISQDPQSASLDPSDAALLVLPVDGIAPEASHQVTAGGFGDCWGNLVNGLTATFGIPEDAEPGDLIINEILFNPFTPGQDFVEIYNRSSKAISLNNWSLANEEEGIPANHVLIADISFVLLPGEYLILTRTGHFLDVHYPFTKTNRIWIMESTPTFNIDSGVGYLIMPDGNVSDLVRYSDQMHFPLLQDTKGVSLERLDFDRPSSDETNWNSAAASQGYATPGYLNSQAFTAGISSEEVSVSPEVFSPDNDGYQDVLTISYTSEEPSLIGNITIFSSEGRRVRRLMRSELLGREGQISWNGTSDEGQALAMGIYVIYFEAFNSEGQVSRIKKTCVLAHQLSGN